MARIDTAVLLGLKSEATKAFPVSVSIWVMSGRRRSVS